MFFEDNVLSKTNQITKDNTEFDKYLPVLENIELWKKYLLDLTRRNRLLYLTEQRAQRLVEIKSPNILQLMNNLVKKGHSLNFPIQNNIQSTLEKTISKGEVENEAGIRKGDIETNFSVNELQYHLYRLRREWLTWQEEQGIQTLFLSTGFLKWKDSQSPNDEYFAPIILIPVGLEKKSLDEPYTLTHIEEDIVVNPALQFKLKTDFGIDLPEISNDFDGEFVEQYLRQLEDIFRKSGWQVTHEARLGRFTYEKFVMYNDLTYHRNEACKHPIICELAKVPFDYHEESIQISDNIDDVTNPVSVFPILDADSSQIEVLLRARSGQNLVIQGPPGTGKSQTIANLIAQGLRENKKILFVSEKMAALEVVNRRLKATGLSFACLEIHSHKSDKVKVVQELAKTLYYAMNTNVELNIWEQYEKLIRLRDQLNNYVKELHTPRGKLGFSAFQVHGRLSKVLNAPKIEFVLPTTMATEVSFEYLDKLLEIISQVQLISHVFNNLVNHPWYGIEVKSENYSNLLFIDEIIGNINYFQDALSALQGILIKVTIEIGINTPTSFEETERLVKLLQLLSKPQPIVQNWLNFSISDLEGLIQEANIWNDRCLKLREQKDILNKKFNLKILTLPIRELLGKFSGDYRSTFRFIKSDYRQDLKTLKQYYVLNNNLSYENACHGLSTAETILIETEWLEQNHAKAVELFGHFYHNEMTDWDIIIHNLEWLKNVICLTNNVKLPQKIAELMLFPEKISQSGDNILNSITPIMNRISEVAEKFSSILVNFDIEGESYKTAPFPILLKWLRTKIHSEDLMDWLKYQRAMRNCQNVSLEDFIKTAKNNQILAKDLQETFLQRFWKCWLTEVYQESPILAEFTATSHEQIIQEFKNLDNKLKEVTIRIIQQNVKQAQPTADTATARESQMGILLREAQKRRRIKPLRRLFAEIPHIIQELKPCLLMSPLSVASYLGTSPFSFDMVIFDEASQIPPADAIGSILRSPQLIVAGDDKQLPPTRFFQADIDFDEETENESQEEPLESILNECLALPNFKRVLLKWHYRSKKEELIDFSNKQFMKENSLLSPVLMHLRHVMRLFFNSYLMQCMIEVAQGKIDRRLRLLWIL